MVGVFLSGTCLAAIPVVQTKFTADPAPLVHDGVVYLYTSHDEDTAGPGGGRFLMKDWQCYTSTDMVNWTDHGAVADLHDFKWAGSGWGGGFENGAWAVQAVERDGRWFLYCPLQGRVIGVLVADNPLGPFHDPIGKPLIGGDNIDPTVFVDNDGQAYLYWGNPKCWYVKLNKDMISYDTTIGDNGLVVLDMTEEAFGKRSKDDEKRPQPTKRGHGSISAMGFIISSLREDQFRSISVIRRVKVPKDLGNTAGL
ncbi:MAG: family 43 glycosylhydrolase [Pontiellaceae bacterium]|nr:family 43 glycosylhydrolase [Pontiellaceae bacterium]MBN2784803.1 family 43 glycosylhydrolase [Pontiellaceae bacterium]